MRSASSQRWRRRHKFTARRRERSRECSRVHQYNSFCAPCFTSGVWMTKRGAPKINEFRVFCFFSSKRHGEGQPVSFLFSTFLTRLFDAEDGKTHTHEWTQRLRESILSSPVVFRCISSLFWLHDLYTFCMLSQFHFSLDAHKAPKGKIYNEQLFQNYWRDYYVPFLRS